jgi:hypothetical protein
MPLIDSQPEFGGDPARIPQTAPVPEGPKPSFTDIAGSAERTSNIVGEAYDRFVNHPKPDDAAVPGFNPIDHIPAGYLHDYGEKFLEAQNPAQVQWIKDRIDDERINQGIIARGGGWGTAATLAAGATDPLTIASMALVPEAAATRMGNALRWAATNAAVTAGQEAIGSQLSATRTPGEAMLNIGAGAVLGGLLGPLAKRIPAGELERLRTKLAPELKPGGEEEVLGPNQRSVLEGNETELTFEPSHVNPEGESTAGAAAVKNPALGDLTTGKGGELIARTIGKVAPGARLMTQPSLEARKLTTELANIPGTLEQNYRGVANPNPIERILWGYDGVHVAAMQERRALYGDYATRMSEAGTDALSRRDFMEEVTKAMRRGDKSAIPEVAKAAQATRARVFQPLYDRALKLGLIPEDAKLYAESYMMRQYDTGKINANLSQWMDTLRSHFISAHDVDPAEATDLAHAVTRNITGSERGTMDWKILEGVVPQSGRLKGRELTVPDVELEPFLNNDIDHLSKSYQHSLAPEVELTERFGDRDLKDQLGAVTDEYAQMIERARAEGDNDKMVALGKQRDSTLKDLQGLRDRLYGTLGAPKDPGSFFVRAGRVLRSFNALRLLGAAALAHFPDLANTMMRYGLPNTFNAMARLATNMQTMKLSLRQAQRMGAAVDMTMNMSPSLLGDYGSHSNYLEQRIMSGAARAFTIATGETPFITLTQALTSTLAQDEILRAAERIAGGGTLGTNRMAALAAAGIDSDMLERIAKEGANHTVKASDLRFGMSDKWADQKAAKAFESAVLREAHGVTLRPGIGDTPLLMSTEWGKLVFQFKSFGFAASRVVGMPLAQGVAHGDIRSATALAALASMGTLSYIAKQKAAGQPLETDPARLAMEVADKSNLMGWTSELIYPGLWQAGFKNLSRWSDRDPMETIGGPSAGTVGSVFQRQLPGRITNPALPFRRSDLHFLRRMAPAQNTWYARRGINHLEDAIADAFDLPGESNEQRELANEVESP